MFPKNICKGVAYYEGDKILFYDSAASLIASFGRCGCRFGFFYCYVFRYTDDSSIDEMDPAYQNATVLDEHFHDTNGCKFIFLETSLKETYIIALEKSAFYDRYRYLPDSTTYIPEERPFSAMIHVPNNLVEVVIDEKNQVSYFNTVGAYTKLSVWIQVISIGILYVFEIIFFCSIWHFYKKRKNRSADRVSQK